MTFTQAAWKAIAGIRSAIHRHPFLVHLEDGSLDPERFSDYMVQDSHYLQSYSRVLALCAAQASCAEDIAFWANGSHRAITVERSLHARHLTAAKPAEPSPTCTAYTSFLLGLAAQGAYPVLTAGVLPCFWIYQDVGVHLRARVDDLSQHPYGDWVGTYGDASFTEVTEQAKATTNRLAATASPHVRQRMHSAFLTAARYEWMFWDAAWRTEIWPV